MSIHLTPLAAAATDIDSENSASSSDEDEDDQTWDDWVSDSAEQPCQSLFEDKTLRSVTEALLYDKSEHGFDLNQICSKLSLDFHQRVRLVNFIRKNKPAAPDVLFLKGSETFFASDEYLLPVLEDDPLLQLKTDDWTDSEEEEQPGQNSSNTARHIHVLEKQLSKAKQDLADYRAFIGERLDVTSLVKAASEPDSTQLPPQDDDSHYFQSYGENDIHAVMIQDKVRTSTYAAFILTTPALFRDAVVLDVGCGTGILSLFAARSGAKRVFAVDASDIADKAEKIVKDNGLEDTITIIRGKVEEISLPEEFPHVDIIISEWMGYALLYESMLDSVLRARDRFLRPGGVMAPSQCKMQLGLCEGSELYKERIAFWTDIYGFDLSAMATGLYDEAIVDVVGPDTLVSDPYTIKDLYLRDITARQLDFSSTFTLTSTVERRTKVHALVLYFDVFFTISGDPAPLGAEAKVIKEHDVVVAEVWPVGGKPPPQRRQSQGEGLKGKDKITSFSTGPRSIPTHWKQTIFFLREPIIVDEGTIVSGTFYCKKSETNTRELDVEIHYSVKEDTDAIPANIVVQMYKVR